MDIYENGSALPDVRACKDCQEIKPVEKFKRVPSGNYSTVCASCSTRKRNATVAALKAGEDPAEEKTTSKRIEKELWKNYRKSKSTGERIRCLELLVKMVPEDEKTAVDDASVVASLMEALKKKKATAKANENV